MFKQASIEDELYHLMAKQLVSNQVESKFGFKKLAQAAELLNAAAEIFDQAGMSEQAEEITEVLNSLANDLQNKL